jgi:DNA-binding transcriptional ArsR family regulator
LRKALSKEYLLIVTEARVDRQRELRDAVALRELAHPVRLRLVDELARMGQATATELSTRVGESAANCSWHLRQLARYGFVEAASHGSGRQRPWRLVAQSIQVRSTEAHEPAVGSAADALTGMLLAREVEAVWAWHARSHQAPPEWREASFVSLSRGWLTATELAEFHAELRQLVARWFRYAERRDPADRPPESEPVQFTTWAFPAQPTDQDNDEESPWSSRR